MQLSIIVPTFNERDNVLPLIDQLNQALNGLDWEVIFVDDDSPDQTAELVRQISQHNPRVRVIQRIGRRGLSTACIEGMLASSAHYLAVMDGDLQHDEKLLPRMLTALQTEPLDIVVGSRYVAGGSLGDWADGRATISRLATKISRLVLQADLTDPMSGFFMVNRMAFVASVHALSGLGFKILLDLFASSPQPLRYQELPYTFKNRTAGVSKLDNQAVWDFGMLLLDKLVGHWIPVRFITFVLIGGVGILVNLCVLELLYRQAGLTFVLSQALAALVAMSSNFFLNNSLTYRDRRLKGWRALRGWFSFCIACSIGAIANVGIAANLLDMHTNWELAALAGVLVGAVWNYAVTTVYTWRPKSVQRARPAISLVQRVKALFSPKSVSHHQ